MDQIYDLYFANQNLPKHRVIEHWTNIAALLRLNPGLLRPSDRFDQILAPPDHATIDDEVEDVYDEYWFLAEDLGIPYDPKQMYSIQDFVIHFSTHPPDNPSRHPQSRG